MKTYLNSFILCLLCGYCFAQLSVNNNAYIFVDGTGFSSGTTVAPLFVTDDVSIESTGNIYLRNDAQLLQGLGTTGNSGIGKLSVYQEGTVHNYAYNYWASPVGEVITNAIGNNDFVAGDVLNDVVTLTTNVPVVLGTSYDGVASPLTVSKHWLYSYNPGTVYADWDFIGNGTALAPGYGFTMKGSIGSTNQQYDFAGKPNSGDINADVIASYFTLVGNPYPSALNVHAFVHDTDNSSDMLGTLLFWEQDLTVSSHVLTSYVAGYASYTIDVTGTIETFAPAMFSTLGIDGFPTGPGTASTSGKQVHQYLPIGQGFMIEGATGTTGTITFKNTHRTFYKESDGASEFFKSNNSSSFNQNQPNGLTEFEYNEEGFQILPQGQGIRRFRLNVDFNNEVSRPLVHNFHPNATNGFDYGLECNNSEPNPRDAYFIDGTMPYVAQANNYDIDLKIPLVVTIDANMPLRVRIYDVQNFNDESIYLHDKVTDVYYDLTVLDFNTNLDSGTYADRFEITFTSNNTTLSAEEFTDSGFSVFQNNTISQLVVANPESLTVESVALMDITGQQVFKKLNLNNTTRYEFSTKSLSDGVYVAKVTLENNNTISKKVSITNK